MVFIDIIFFAAIAIFLGYRLWSLLGTHEKEQPIAKRRSEEDDLIVSIRPRVRPSSEFSHAAPTSTPPEENEEAFLKGATLAFHQIVEAYAEGEIEVLRKLLEGPLLETFENAIATREKEKKTLEIHIERLMSAEILDKREEGAHLYKTVRFVSEQCLVTRNEKGKILMGDPDQYNEVVDIWTFSRLAKSANPNWKLVATQLPEE